MTREDLTDVAIDTEQSVSSELPNTPAGVSRRTFLQVLGAGLLITVTREPSTAQRRSSGGRSMPVLARLHLNPDGTVTVLTGKVEEGQGARAELSQAAAEELHVPVDQVRLIMADTDLVPDDGITAGSRTTPINVPAVRSAAATARELLEQLAADTWNVEPRRLEVCEGTIVHPDSVQRRTYADLARLPDTAEIFKQAVRADVTLVPLGQWKTMGTSVARPNLRDLVTGIHRYPSDIIRPGQLYGKVLRPPAYGATLESIDLSAARAMDDVVVVQDEQWVGFAAPTTFKAEQALSAAAKTAQWKTVPQVSSQQLFAHLKQNVRTGNRSRARTQGDIEKGLAHARQVLSATYEVAYVQHTPMEPRAATAEWQDDRLTVWTGVDSPQRVQGNLARAFKLSNDRVRLIVPDMGGGFGGKHTGEAAEEAARLARAAGHPVAVHWTRAEEFTWAYFRPAALIECKAGLTDTGSLVAWDFTNINAGGSAIDPPYTIRHTRTLSAGSDSPLRQGAYRCLAATANNFARESFMDEMAAAAGKDPLAFRMEHLNNPRIRNVLEAAARRFNWSQRKQNSNAERGVGLACGTEKNSVVAACVEVAIDRSEGKIQVLEVCEAFECGPIINPDNLVSQVQGCICMGLGPALREAVVFENGKIMSNGFHAYRVPRFQDIPKIDVLLVENRDIPSAGGGETPIIAVAPAIANAVFGATGVRLRSMPLQSDRLKV